MHDENDSSVVNGILGKVCELDGGRKLHFKRIFADGLLEIDCLREHRQFKVQDEIIGELRIPDTGWLEDMLRQGRLRVPDHEPIKSPDRAALEMDREQILEKDPYAEVRRDLLRRVVEAGSSGNDPKLGAVISRIWKEQFEAKVDAISVARPDIVRMKRPEISTVRTFLRKLDPLVATLAQVMHKTGLGQRAPRLDAEVIEVLKEGSNWFYDFSGRRIIDVRGEVKRLIDVRNLRRAAENLSPLPYPSDETIRRYVAAGENRDSFARKFGEKAARSRWDGQGQALTASKILAVALIDDTVLDAVAVFDADRNMPAGRPWLTVIMDVYSRAILGWMLDFVPPNHHTAAETLRRANRPKIIRPEKLARHSVLAQINGKPDLLIADNGTGFASPAFQQVCADLGITLQLAAVGSPRAKAMLERFFYTLKTYLLEKLPGHTFTPTLLKEFDIDPEKEAALTLSELVLLIQTFVDAYHITEHSGIGMPPALKWKSSMGVHGRSMVLDERRFDISTGVTLHNRRLYRGGIRVLGLVYRDPAASRLLNDDLVAAEPHRKRVRSGATVATVRIKYNPANLGCIWVWNHVSCQWVELPCTDLEYADGLTLWQHRQIKAWAKRRSLAFTSVEERMEARRQLNDLIVELAPDMRARERRAVARMLGQSPISEIPVELAEANPSHAGNGAIIEHRTNEDRSDAHVKPDRPARNAGRPDPDSGTPNEEEQEEDDSAEAGADEQDLDTGDTPAPVEGSEDDDSRFKEWE